MRRVLTTIVAVENKSVTHSVCVFVDLGTQHVMLMRYIVICGVSGITIFFHIIP